MELLLHPGLAQPTGFWGVGSLQPLLSCAGTATAPGFSCWKQCQSRSFLCSWPPLGPIGNTSYLLTFCYTPPKPCQEFKVGTNTTYKLSHHRVYIFINATAWVEGRWGNHTHRTPNITLYLNEAVKLDPPPAEMSFNRTGGQLWLQMPRPPCQRSGQPLQREARFQRPGDRGWTQVTCEAVMGKDDDSVTCALGQNSTFEVQLRHKLPYWSSYWSNWSSSIFIPEEIQESPVLSYQLGKLGRNGQRVLRLDWQQAPKEQGDVTYTLRAHMPACRCTKLVEDDVVVLREVTMHNLTLSGAEYQIVLTAANAAGPGPQQQIRVPAEEHADFGFEDISVEGGTVTAQWEAPSPGSVYCFEQQALPGEPKQGSCIQRDFPAGSVHVERGALEVPACHRLAVHGWAPEQGWATFALRHHYASNASLAVPIRINASTGDATTIVLQWSPPSRATCPGTTAKYLICHMAKGDNVTYAEVEAAVSHHTLQNLRPGTAYRVAVQEVTAESRRTCGTWWHFQTKALGPQGAAWKSNMKYMGISLSLPIMAIIYQMIKKRAYQLLFPPLPKPMDTKAIQFFTSEISQSQPGPGFVEPSERFSPVELLMPEPNPSKELLMPEPNPSKELLMPEPNPSEELLMPEPNPSKELLMPEPNPSEELLMPEPNPSKELLMLEPNPSKELLMPEPNPGKEMTNTSTWPGTPQPGPTAEELVALCPPGCEQELPFAYRRQEVLCPEALSPPSSISCISHVPNEEEEKEEEGKWGLHQPLIPITLLISNKPIIIRNEEGQDPSQELVPQPVLDQGQQGWMAGEGQGHAMGC
ncbi:LOW QUALITY PROTEIN: interleukin-12 receptor subunit beta-1 [Pogoniulus pusillus]|uniref:LOW QUALITY PROTEIN: interleukin-12 receptor subunit beta-1 n=1 Tax=Pogoniulus pusillus TaxID=488313 RepID=UPI0030B93C46